MLKFKAEDFGLEPNVTGFEESINLAFLDGKREGKSEGYDEGKSEGLSEGYDQSSEDTARNLLDLGVDEEIISKATGLDLDSIQSLKKQNVYNLNIHFYIFYIIAPDMEHDFDIKQFT